MTSPDVGKLRELAEQALRDWAEVDEPFGEFVFGCDLARGLLSVLDALEAANERLQEGSAHALRLPDRAFAARSLTRRRTQPWNDEA